MGGRGGEAGRVVVVSATWLHGVGGRIGNFDTIEKEKKKWSNDTPGLKLYKEISGSKLGSVRLWMLNTTLEFSSFIWLLLISLLSNILLYCS